MTKLWLILLILILALLAVVLFLLLRTSGTTEAESATVQKLTPSEVQTMMASGAPFVLLDVREPSEFDEGHIPDAISMPLGTLSERAPFDISDKDMPLIVYCRSGRRSAEAAQLLLILGFQSVFDLGGILDWPYEIQRPE